MQLTEKQLKIQERADKTLSLGCIVERYKWEYETFACLKAYSLYLEYAVVDWTHLYKETTTVDNFQKIKIIWHPMTYSRLLYFMTIYKDCDLLTDHIVEYVLKNPNVLNETVLERPEYLLDRVIDFLDTLPKDD